MRPDLQNGPRPVVCQTLTRAVESDRPGLKPWLPNTGCIKIKSLVSIMKICQHIQIKQIIQGTTYSHHQGSKVSSTVPPLHHQCYFFFFDDPFLKILDIM